MITSTLGMVIVADAELSDEDATGPLDGPAVAGGDITFISTSCSVLAPPRQKQAAKNLMSVENIALLDVGTMMQPDGATAREVSCTP